MAITLGTPTNSGNQATSSGFSFNHTTAANTKCLVVVVTGMDSSATDSVVSGVTFNTTDVLTEIPGGRYRVGNDFVSIWYKTNPQIGGAYSVTVTMGGACTDVQATAIGLIDATASSIVYDSYDTGTGTGSASAVVSPAATGSVAVGGGTALGGTAGSLSVTAGTEISGSEVDMGNQTASCATAAESGGTATLTWAYASATCTALAATFKVNNTLSVSTASISTVDDVPAPILPINIKSDGKYFQGFYNTTIPTGWTQKGDGTWNYDGTDVTQTVVGAADPSKILYTATDFGSLNFMVMCKITFDTVDTSDTNQRLGIAIHTSNTTSLGVQLVWNSTTPGQLRYLDEGVSWEPGTAMVVAAGESWWFKCAYVGNTYYGKAWKITDAEPAAWQRTYTRTPAAGQVYAGIVGEPSNWISKGSYDNFTVSGVTQTLEPENQPITEAVTVTVAVPPSSDRDASTVSTSTLSDVVSGKGGDAVGTAASTSTAVDVPTGKAGNGQASVASASTLADSLASVGGGAKGTTVSVTTASEAITSVGGAGLGSTASASTLSDLVLVDRLDLFRNVSVVSPSTVIDAIASVGGVAQGSTASTSTATDTPSLISNLNPSAASVSTVSETIASKAGAGVASAASTSTTTDTITSKAGDGLASTVSVTTITDTPTLTTPETITSVDASTASASTLTDSIVSKAGDGQAVVASTSTLTDIVTGKSGNAQASAVSVTAASETISATASAALANTASTSTPTDSITSKGGDAQGITVSPTTVSDAINSRAGAALAYAASTSTPTENILTTTSSDNFILISDASTAVDVIVSQADGAKGSAVSVSTLADAITIGTTMPPLEISISGGGTGVRII